MVKVLENVSIYGTYQYMLKTINKTAPVNIMINTEKLKFRTIYRSPLSQFLFIKTDG